jgi:integrase
MSTGWISFSNIINSGLRLLECICLRVKDIDFANNLLIIRAGKGEKDRTTILPDKIKESLKLHLQRIKKMHDQDLAKGYGGTTLPDALEKKYPQANKEWAGQWVFPSKSLVIHPVSGIVLRHHVQPSSLQRMIKEALRKSFHSDAAAFYSTKQRRLTFLRLGSPFQAGALAALSGRRSRVPELGSFLDGWLLLCQESIALDIRNGLHSTG